MKARHIISTLAILGSPFAAAQNVTENPAPDPVLEAIQEFKNRDKETAGEVPAAEPSATPPAPVNAEPASPEPSAAVLVTGKSPETSVPEAAPQEPVTVVEEAPKPTDGLTVRVEKLHTGTGTVDPSMVKLLAPYPAKPLSQAPAGWRLDTSDSAPPLTREVELSPGSKITLTIRPHLLVPDADGANVFTISEPGFDPALGYHQTATVGAILANSIRQLDEDSKQLGNAIDNLQQLLVSLPKPEPAPVAEPAKPVINRKK